MVVAAFYVDLKKRLLRRFDRQPGTNLWLFDGMSVNARRVKEGAAGWRALKTVYNFTAGEGKNYVSRVADTFWLHIRNAQAARNRLVIAKREVTGALAAFKPLGRPIRILSLAAGTAQGVIEAVAETGTPTQLLLIDQDPTALEYAQTLAREHGVGGSLVTRHGNIMFFDTLLDGFEPDIIEMMGLTDYLRDTTAVALFRKIFRSLRSGGLFLTCHIHPNMEAYFLSRVANWKMLYRSKSQFKDILIRGGFVKLRLLTEPLAIHSVAIGTK